MREEIKFDEDTGAPIRRISIPLKGRSKEQIDADIEELIASGILTEGGDAEQAPGDSLSSPTLEEGDAQSE